VVVDADPKAFFDHLIERVGTFARSLTPTTEGEDSARYE
jgi:hypothetical protein